MIINFIIDNFSNLLNFVTFGFLDLDYNIINESIQLNEELKNLARSIDDDSNNQNSMIEVDRDFSQINTLNNNAETFGYLFEDLITAQNDLFTSFSEIKKVQIMSGEDFKEISLIFQDNLSEFVDFFYKSNSLILSELNEISTIMDSKFFNYNKKIMYEHEKLIVTENSKNLYLLYDISFLILKSQQTNLSDSSQSFDKDFFSREVFDLENIIKRSSIYNLGESSNQSNENSSDSSASPDALRNPIQLEKIIKFFQSYNSTNFIKKNITKPLLEDYLIKSEKEKFNIPRSILKSSLKKNFQNFIRSTKKKY